ncbi:tetratricopeptide repeat protein [Paludibacterium purpuratum]|uniref:Tetratricopeptide repeat protein n=1 Tax=Paludibacterium purpuratum TaxID=1144873 RepID=A0A4V3DUQ1_9NEIS|nr:tetratricopeptide repeat protein [Paludibacterium purpuratum]TDR73615.1 tetratricopeptide repeat protein [Paludibacterium purpuratum]
MSTAAPKRLRLLPLYQLIGLSLLLVLLLALVFPHASLRSRLLGHTQADQLAIAYLEAWQRVEPDNPDVLATLTREYLKGQRAGDARRLIVRLKSSHDVETRRDALLIEIGLAQAALFAENQPAVRQARAADLAQLLDQALPLPWHNDQLTALADTARLSGQPDLADSFYTRLAQSEPARAAIWWRKSCALRLSRQQYARAADACLAAQAHGATRDERRTDFIAALRALQMGNLLPQALQLAGQRGGSLLGDATTLRFLANLALAGGRPDLAQDYVRRLLAVDRATPPVVASQPARMMPAAWVRPAGSVVLSDWQPPHAAGSKVIEVDPALYMPSAGARPHKMALILAQPAGTAQALDQNGADLDLAYRVFMANGNLAEAQKIARQALDAHLDAALWRPRLAQTSLWNNDPATALAQFLLLAEHSQDEKLWQQIETLANGLNDTAAQLQVYRHRLGQRPDDLALIDQIVAAYEMTGAPETALAFLRERSAGPNRIAILSRLAALALRAGHDQLAIDTWLTLDRIDGPKPAYALPLAQRAYLQGRFADAMALLRAAAPAATPADDDYWRAYFRLATLTQDSAAVVLASQQLQAGGNLDESTGVRWLDELDDRPADAARTAWRLYRQSGSPLLLARAISAYVRLGELDRIPPLLAQLDEHALAQASANADFLMARAEYARLAGDPKRSLNDLARASRFAPGRTDVIAARLWNLTALGQEKALRTLLARYARQAENDPGLISIYADAWLALGEPHRALHYFDLAVVDRTRDPLWQLAYAEALELAQRPGAAWMLRRHVWRDLLPPKLAAAKRQESRDALLANLSGLSNSFADGDRSLALLHQALARPETEDSALPPAIAAAAVAWAQSHDATALERAWLAKRYVNWLAQPAQAQLSLALAEQDTTTLERLLAEKRGQLPIDSRIEALAQTGRLAEAQSEAFDGVEHQPDNDDLQAVLREQLLNDAQTVTPSWRSVRQSGLKYDQFGLSAGLRLDARQALQLSFSQRNQRSDATRLPGAPGQDRTAALSYRFGDDSANRTLTVASRQGWRAVTPVRVDGVLQPRGAWNFNYALGSEQPADETSQLLLGGMKNLASLGVGWRQGRWFANSRVEADRFYMQDRSFLGEGYLAALDAGYKFRLGYPDYTLHLVATHGQYSAYGTPSEQVQQLVPQGTVGLAATIMPQTFSQGGLLLSFGTDLPDGYRHAFLPYLEAGPMYDTHAHWGGVVNVGLVGSVLGRDRLSIYYQHQDMSAQGSSPVTEVGVRYSWFY